MKYIPMTSNDEYITVVLQGKPYMMATTNPNFEKVLEAWKQSDEQALLDLFDQKVALQNYVDGSIEIKDNKLFCDGEELHGHVVDRIFNHMEKGLDFKPLLRFIEKLQNNPSRRAVNELYSFLEHKNMPVTENGNFIAYKGVDENYKDFHTRSFDNSVGQTLEMKRNSVCDDANVGCSHGFHAGSYDYARGYASGGGHLMLVEINPEDVVSVPLDCNQQKLRTSKYVVVEHCEHILKQEIYFEDEDELTDEELDDLCEQDVNENSAGDVKSLLAGLKKLLRGRSDNHNN